MRRILTAAVVSASVLALATGCTGEAETTCTGGDVRLLQQIPSDLPGGGNVGFTEVDTDADPFRVHLMAPAGSDVPDYVEVGDTFTVAGAEYRVTCISASVVTLDDE